MSRELEEQDAIALGALLRMEVPGHEPLSADDQYWLQETASDLMAVVDSRAGQSTFPLLRDAETQGRRRTFNVRAWAGAAAIAAGALLAYSLSTYDSEPSITFVVQNSTGAASEAQEVGRVRAPANEDRTLQFSEGSTLKLASGGSVRVRETDADGAEVVIENGRLESSVTHLEDTSWSVFAGPYEIKVIGTKFSTDWDPATQRLVVLLDEGAVRVIGSNIEDHVSLKPGQRFDAAPNEAWKVTAQAPPPHAKEETAVEEAPALEEEPAAPAEVATPAAVAPTKKSWNQLLADGKFQEILSDAESQGLSNCYSSCSVSRLRSLADAARYTGEVSVAREALLKLRARAPSESARAGYLLGSLSEARGQAASALSWYQGYLQESPGGPFTAEARAGKMRALHALGRRSDARRAASDYLRLHPRGTSAATARRILNKK